MAGYQFALLGDPVEHSRSPEIHRVLFELSGLEGDYQTVRADRAALSEAVSDLRSGVWDGLNVTMPLKREAAGIADILTPQAERSGSVNTLVRALLGVEGHSTDGTTFLELVADERFDGIDGPVFVLGAGGSCAAVLAALAQDRRVHLAARNRAQAEEMARRFGAEVVYWGATVADSLVINTTPIGMGGEMLPDGVIEVAAGLIDLPYGTETTPAIETAQRLGRPVADGHEFLTRQAMASFALWTGTEVGFDRLWAALRKV